MVKFVAGVITTLLLVALIGGGYLWFTKPSITTPIPVITQTPSPTEIMLEDKTASASSDSYEKPINGFVNPSSTIDAIETALRNKLYGSLASYMNASVSVTIDTTTTTLGKSAAVERLSVLNTAVQPWDFGSTNAIATQLIANKPLIFKDAFIGTTKNYYAAAFNFDDVYLIRKIYITKNYRPLITK